ncbi:asparagine synthase, partial [Streptomyces rubellomurinus subsp. indigoferus]
FWNLRDVAAEGRERARVGDGPDLVAKVVESTRRHLLCDVPVVTFLSGGLDSSYLTALAARHRPGSSAYTIGFRAEDARFEAMPDDLRHARQVAERFGVDLHEIEIAMDVLDLLRWM